MGWLWRNVSAVNKITLVAGAVGVGKSLLVAADLAARVSAGSAWPDGTPGAAADVLIASGNDDTHDTLVPRLEAHGADLARVHFLAKWEAGRLECGPAGELVDHVGRAREKRDALAAAFISDFLAAGPRMWTVIEQHGKLAGHRTGTLERVRSSVAEPFKRQEQDGRWLWRLIGDQRTGSEGDIADFFARGQADTVAMVGSDTHGGNELDLSGDGANDVGDE